MITEDLGFKFKYTTALRKIRQLKKQIRVIQGSTSGGKTIGIIAEMIDLCTKNENYEMSVVGESVPQLKKGALKDFIKIMKKTGRWRQSGWNGQERKYTFTTGSYMEFFSPESILGARRTHLYINEAINISFEDYNQLQIRTEMVTWIDYNPARHFWVHSEVIPDSDAEFIILTYKDNEALTEKIIKDIEKARTRAESGDPYWINWWNVYGLGQIGTMEGVIYPLIYVFEELPTKINGQAEEFIPDCYGLDFGYNHASVLVGLKQIDGCNYAREEVFEKEKTSAQLIEIFERKKIRKDKIIYADGSRPEIIADIRMAGYWITEAVKDVKDGIDAVQKAPLYIHNSSIEGLRQTRNYQWKKKKGEETFLDEPVKNEDDFPDALRYAIYSHQKKGMTGGMDLRVTQRNR